MIALIAALLGSGLALGQQVDDPTQGYWTKESPETVPAKRRGAVMAYDPKSERVLMFGGSLEGNDTWLWDGQEWEQIFPPVAPPGPPISMAYDEARGKVVLLTHLTTEQLMESQTWLWDGSEKTWEKLEVPSPPQRQGAAMAYDRHNEHIVLFGGTPAGEGPLNDTWLFNGSEWRQVDPQVASSPSPRSQSSLAYDAERKRVVLFGGGGAAPLDETWTWNGAVWRKENPPNRPTARFAASMIYDEVSKVVVLTGGSNPTLPAITEQMVSTWSWDGSDWTRQVTSVSPSLNEQRSFGRYGAAMAFDSKRGKGVLFGGQSGNATLQDTWTWDGGSIAKVAPGPRPEPAFSVADTVASAQPGASTSAVFSIAVTPSSTSPVSVGYSTVDQTATAPHDYTHTSGALHFDPNQSHRTVTVPIAPASGSRTTKTFLLKLSNPEGGAIQRGEATGTIVQLSVSPPEVRTNSLWMTGAGVAVPRNASTVALFTINLQFPALTPIAVDYETEDGHNEGSATPARAQEDYEAVSGTVVFGPGETQKTVPVTVFADPVTEGPEFFILHITRADGVFLRDTRAGATLKTIPEMRVEDTEVKVPLASHAADTYAYFQVILEHGMPNDIPVTVDFSTADGTAKAGVDYLATSGTLTMDWNIPYKSIPVQILNDGQSTGNKHFMLQLSSPGNAKLVRGTAVGTILEDPPFSPKRRLPGGRFQRGDVFAAGGGGAINWFTPEGELIDRLTPRLPGLSTGMTFDATDNLNVTQFRFQRVDVFDSSGKYRSELGASNDFEGYPESIVFDATGNSYVGQVATGGQALGALVKLSPTGERLAVFYPAAVRRGVDWMDLAADQCTMFYTSESADIKRYDVCRGIQLPDFATSVVQTGWSTVAYALRLLPNGDVLAASHLRVLRFDSQGRVIQTYEGHPDPQFPILLFALNLDPDGSSFWTQSTDERGTVFKYDLESGRVLHEFSSPGSVSRGGLASTGGGLAVFGECTAARACRQVSVYESTVTRPDIGTVDAEFPVTLEPPTAVPVTIDYHTRDGSAKAGKDYIASSGTLTFPPNATRATIKVPVLGGTDPQPTKNFTVHITRPPTTNVAIGKESAVGTILDAHASVEEPPSVRDDDDVDPVTRTGTDIASRAGFFVPVSFPPPPSSPPAVNIPPLLQPGTGSVSSTANALHGEQAVQQTAARALQAQSQLQSLLMTAPVMQEQKEARVEKAHVDGSRSSDEYLATETSPRSLPVAPATTTVVAGLALLVSLVVSGPQNPASLARDKPAVRSRRVVRRTLRRRE